MASYQLPRYGRGLVAGADLSAKQYHYVKDDGTNSAVIAGGATGAIGAGFLENFPALGEECNIMTIGGGAKGVCAEIVSGPNIELKADANGQMVLADTAGDIVCAISQEAAAVGDVFELLPVLYRKHA